jgi:hypothetical protein
MVKDKQDMKLQSFFVRMVRAAKLDINLYDEVEANVTTSGQACLAVILSSLAIGIGAGIAGMFKWAGIWSIWGLLIILIGSIVVWLICSSLAYFTGTRLFKGHKTSATVGELLRAIGFSASPGVLGILLFIPTVGGFIWLGASIWALAAGVVAVKQALDFTTTRAIMTCLVSWFGCIIIIVLTIAMSLIFLIDGSCTLGSGFNSRVNSIVGQYRFSITAWEVTALPHELSQWIRASEENVDDAVELVTEYFSVTAEQKRDLENKVELILENQIEESLIKQDIFGFPPVNLKLDTMPRLLVISPRDEIESMREIMLDNGLSSQEIDYIETRVDNLNVSSLIVQLGGFGGAYPSFVTNSASLRFTVKTAVEEWIHQYLAFKPLGFRYLLDILGIARNYEIATMNETVAGMVSDEICAIVCDRYYSEQKEPVEDTSDFDLEMREIRLAVDDYLARGEIELAEEYMEQKRQYLASRGYYIRKLNQAYFAWYGTYADEPSSVSPIGVELKQLRSQCDSVKEFLDTVAMMTSRQDLKDKVELLQ